MLVWNAKPSCDQPAFFRARLIRSPRIFRDLSAFTSGQVFRKEDYITTGYIHHFTLAERKSTGVASKNQVDRRSNSMGNQNTGTSGKSREIRIFNGLSGFLERVQTWLKLFYALMLAMLCAVLLSGCPWGGGGSDGSTDAQNALLLHENFELTRENSALRTEITKVKSREGYLVMSVGMSIFSAAILLCVGLACGMRIKKAVLAHEEKQVQND